MRPPNSEIGVVVAVVVVCDDELDSVLMLDDFLLLGLGRFSSSTTPASWLLRFFANLIPHALQSLKSTSQQVSHGEQTKTHINTPERKKKKNPRV